MAFILGVLPMISDTSGPIGMKLWECIKFTLKPCIVIFSTSDFDLKPEVGCFLEIGSWKRRNRKSKSISSESSWVFVIRVLSSKNTRKNKAPTSVENWNVKSKNLVRTYFWINTLQGHLLVDRLLWSWDTISVSLSVLVVIGVILWFCHDVICDRFNELKIEILYEMFPKKVRTVKMTVRKGSKRPMSSLW